MANETVSRKERPPYLVAFIAALSVGVILVLVLVIAPMAYFRNGLFLPSRTEEVEDGLFEKTLEGFSETQLSFEQAAAPQELLDSIPQGPVPSLDFYYDASIENSGVVKIHRLYRYQRSAGGGILTKTTFLHTCVEYTGLPGVQDPPLTQKSVTCPDEMDFGSAEEEVLLDDLTKTVKSRQ